MCITEVATKQQQTEDGPSVASQLLKNIQQKTCVHDS